MKSSLINEAAPYQRLYERLKTNIRQGRLRGKLPSIAELTRDFAVSHGTIKKALDRLKEQHYIYGMQGKGVYVNESVSSNPAFQKNIVFYLHIETYRNPFYLQSLSRLRQLLEEKQSFVHLVNSPKQLSELSDNTDILLAVDIKEDAEFEEIKKLVKPDKIIFFNRLFEDLNCVVTDNIEGGYMAVKYLYDKGHRQIGLLSRDLQYAGSFFDHRYQGVCRFAAEHPDLKLINSELQISLTIPDEQTARSASADLLDRAPDITAVFAFTDILALGFVSYCHDNRIVIPDDISLIGFDNRDFASLLSPPLTTIQENSDELAVLTLKQIDKIIAGNMSHEQISVEPFLVERESVKVIYQ